MSISTRIPSRPSFFPPSPPPHHHPFSPSSPFSPPLLPLLPECADNSCAKNKSFLAMLDGCVGMVQTDELRVTVQTVSRQSNMINVNNARAAASRALKKNKEQLIAEVAAWRLSDTTWVSAVPRELPRDGSWPPSVARGSAAVGSHARGDRGVPPFSIHGDSLKSIYEATHVVTDLCGRTTTA